ncbi:O-antigen ligase family protein [Bdellovibrio sp. HCB2-146]|uniref:O-antigen ligase family protein n=1 Tax=Bdellovibrio sp. HCB2-146 TaxID=3394362 RepID=UPI0039BC686B
MSLGVMFLTSVYWSIKYQKANWSWPRLGLKWLWAVWVAVIAGGLLFNPVKGDWSDYFFEFRWIIDFYVMILFFSVFKDDSRLIKVLSFILTIASACAVVFYFIGFNPLSETLADRAAHLADWSRWRAGGLYDHAMPLAHSYGPILLVFVGLLLVQWEKRKELPVWVYSAVALTGLTVLLTLTRGVWIGVATGLVVMGFFINRKLGALIVGGLLVIGLTIFASSETIRNRVMITVNMTNQGDHERLTLWRTNWEMIKDHPLIGTGYGQNKARLREYYDRLGIDKGYFEGHAHNQYIHFLAGTGFVGLLCYLIFIGYGLRASIKTYKLSAALSKTKGLALGCIGALVSFYVGSLTEANFSIGKNRYMILFIMAWGVALYLQEQKKKS